MCHYDMLEKSELKITDIRLDGANLHRIADCVADIYGVARDKVLVIDVRNGEVALDILDNHADPHSFISREKELLARVGRIPGVSLGEKARITSDGMLGWIAFEAGTEEIEESLAETERMSQEIMRNIKKRVIVFPSGTEVEAGEIEDTNTPMLLETLTKAGYEAEAGPILKDDEYYIAGKLRWAIGKGFGTIITTGGVGAEDKDHSVEAVLDLDPGAAAPYIAKFEKGHGRHVKDGIRIGVGESEHVRMITLPGPNDEVALCIPVLLEGLKKSISKEEMAESLANVLRKRLQEKCSRHAWKHHMSE